MKERDKSRSTGLLVAALLCFGVAAVSLSGLILRTDYAGRIIFGAAWGALGIVWFGKYLFGGRRARRSKSGDTES